MCAGIVKFSLLKTQHAILLVKKKTNPKKKDYTVKHILWLQQFVMKAAVKSLHRRTNISIHWFQLFVESNKTANSCSSITVAEAFATLGIKYCFHQFRKIKTALPILRAEGDARWQRWSACWNRKCGRKKERGRQIQRAWIWNKEDKMWVKRKTYMRPGREREREALNTKQNQKFEPERQLLSFACGYKYSTSRSSGKFQGHRIFSCVGRQQDGHILLFISTCQA